MALTIEDGTIVANANSYITIAEYNTWADARFGASRSTAPDDTVAEQIILRAMDYFETLSFIGRQAEDNQPLQWPRSWVSIDGFAVEANEIPKEVKNSIYELAYAEEQGEGQLNVIERKVTSETVGPISVSYDKSTSRSTVVASSRSMRKLLKGGGGGFVVNRA